MGLPISPNCHLCRDVHEHINHLFFECPHAQDFWKEMLQNIGSGSTITMQNLYPPHWLSTWSAFKHKSFDSHILWSEILPYCLWNIWCARSHNVFNNTKVRPSFKQAYAEAMEFKLLTTNGQVTKRRSIIEVCWQPPQVGRFKLNIDGSFLGNPEKGGIGGLIRNHNGEWILGFNKSFLHATNNQMELLVLLEGLTICETNQFMPIEIDTDSLEVIKLLQNGNMLYNRIIHEYRSKLIALGRPTVSHAYREQNGVADALAKHGAQATNFQQAELLLIPPM